MQYALRSSYTFFNGTSVTNIDGVINVSSWGNFTANFIKTVKVGVSTLSHGALQFILYYRSLCKKWCDQSSQFQKVVVTGHPCHHRKIQSYTYDTFYFFDMILWLRKQIITSIGVTPSLVHWERQLKRKLLTNATLMELSNCYLHAATCDFVNKVHNIHMFSSQPRFKVAVKTNSEADDMKLLQLANNSVVYLSFCTGWWLMKLWP